MSNSTYSIAMIGGVCTGKSSFCKLFLDQGVSVISADEVVRDLYNRPSCREKIAKLFEFQSPSEFSLSHIRHAVLTCQEKRQQLEAIFHPLVFDEIAQMLSQVKSPYCIVEMPLFVEIQCPIDFDRVLLIDAPEHLQLQRLQKRKIDHSQAKDFVSIQAVKSERYHVAHEVIWNTVEKRFLVNIVNRLHQHYLVLSANCH